MNTMTGRRIAAMLGAAGSLLITLPGMAQTPGALPTNQAEFEKQLGITPDQKKKLEASTKKYQAMMQKVQEKYKPQALKLQQQMMDLQKKAQAEARPIMESQKKEFMSLLNPTQQKKFKDIETAIQQQQRAAQQGGGGMMGGPNTGTGHR